MIWLIFKFNNKKVHVKGNNIFKTQFQIHHRKNLRDYVIAQNTKEKRILRESMK